MEVWSGASTSRVIFQKKKMLLYCIHILLLCSFNESISSRHRLQRSQSDKLSLIGPPKFKSTKRLNLKKHTSIVLPHKEQTIFENEINRMKPTFTYDESMTLETIKKKILNYDYDKDQQFKILNQILLYFTPRQLKYVLEKYNSLFRIQELKHGNTLKFNIFDKRGLHRVSVTYSALPIYTYNSGFNSIGKKTTIFDDEKTLEFHHRFMRTFGPQNIILSESHYWNSKNHSESKYFISTNYIWNSIGILTDCKKTWSGIDSRTNSPFFFSHTFPYGLGSHNKDDS